MYRQQRGPSCARSALVLFALPAGLFYRPAVRSRATRWTLSALALAAGWALAPGAAQAQAQGSPQEPTPLQLDAPPIEEEELGPEAGIRRPAAPDQRTGHWLIQPRLALSVPFGSVATDLPASAVVGAGPAFGVSAGLGLSRYTVLEATGGYALLPGSSRCGGCSSQSLDLGLGLVYHLAQGIAFDPWISYGIAYRRSSFEGDPQTSRRVFTDFSGSVLQGLDVARIALGGDFYPLPWLGFGLFLEVDAGTYLARPENLGRSTYGFFQAGLRLALDPARQGGGAQGRVAWGHAGTGF